jgi:hypothetical protein
MTPSRSNNIALRATRGAEIGSMIFPKTIDWDIRRTSPHPEAIIKTQWAEVKVC